MEQQHSLPIDGRLEDLHRFVSEHGLTKRKAELVTMGFKSSEQNLATVPTRGFKTAGDYDSF